MKIPLASCSFIWSENKIFVENSMKANIPICHTFVKQNAQFCFSSIIVKKKKMSEENFPFKM